MPPGAARLLRRCKAIIQQVLPNATVLLYGSLARGTAGPDSDWDILVLTPKALTAAEEDPIRDALYRLELEHGIVLSLFFYAQDQWDHPLHRASPFHRNVQREGVLI